MSKLVNHKNKSKATNEGKRKRGTGPSTGYILFTKDAHPKVRAENPGLQFSELSRLVADKWRGLDDKTKKEYKEKAKEQTARMEAERILVPKPITHGYILFVARTHGKVR